MSDDNSLDGFFATQEALAKLTPEELHVLDKEMRWIEAQKATGRIPSPESLAAKAPIYLRLLADMGEE